MGRMKLRPKGTNSSGSQIVRLDHQVQIPVHWLPSGRSYVAIQNGVEKDILINTWGGLGDQACAEPAIRYAMKHFHGCKFTLASEKPDLFQHLKFERVFDLAKEQPIWDKYFMFRTIHSTEHISWEFMSHMLTQAVDYCSLNMFRLQMPIADKEINLFPSPLREHLTPLIPNTPQVLVHAGRHWQTKTFPKWFWDAVLAELIALGVLPVLIGANTEDNRGTVDVNPEGCLDLRNKTNINDLMYLCKNADVLLTNDSSPMHIASAGRAWIGFIATCKHPDYIMHWRQGVWAWRMKNFGVGGIWDSQNYCPNTAQTIEVDKVDPKILESWLPDPKDYAKWAAEKAYEEFSWRVDKK